MTRHFSVPVFMPPANDPDIQTVRKSLLIGSQRSILEPEQAIRCFSAFLKVKKLDEALKR